MVDLATTLARFNRKERYWLLRAALGDKSKVLDDNFLHQLGQATGLSIPASAWWAMDYHLDWLVGALHLLRQSEQVTVTAQPPVEKPPDNVDKLVCGTHEDIDLIVAFENTLLLVEAKGDTAWSNYQIRSKHRRLSVILEQFKDMGRYPAITFKLVLTSPSRPQKLKPGDESPWPEWMLGQDGMLCHVPLWIGDSNPFQTADSPEPSQGMLIVTRCNDQATPDANGSHWAILPARDRSEQGHAERLAKRKQPQDR